MGYYFNADFSFCGEDGKPYDILIEQNTDLSHLHSTVKNGEYRLLVPGNKHLVWTPALKNFRTKFNLRIDTPPSQEECEFYRYGFRLFFRYDRFLRQGYLLEVLIFHQTISACLFTINSRNEKIPIAKSQKTLPAKFNRYRLDCKVTVEENRVETTVNGIGFNLIDKKNTFPGAGMIGIDRPFFSGELIIKKWLITSAEKVTRFKIAGPIGLELPCEHGMSVPYKYVLNLYRYQSGPYVMEIKLSGGIKERPQRIKRGDAWTHEMDRLTTPYVRIDSESGEIRKIILHSGSITLLDPEEKRPWLSVLYRNIPWPLKRKVYFETLPDVSKIVFAVGYEFFENDPMNFLAGGPMEVICDVQGQVLYKGTSLHRGKIGVKVSSPPDKLLCSLIPDDIPDRKQAVEHARKNHYFLHKEKIRFSIDVYYHWQEFFSGELMLSLQVQDVFGEMVDTEILISGGREQENPLKEKLGIVVRQWTAELSGSPEPGIYHLKLFLSLDNRTIYGETVIFEVISEDPDAPPAPIASGLPELFSDTTETQYLERNAFDPLSETAGAMHYYSICYFPSPDGARRKQIWRLLGLYHRKLFLSFTPRTTDGELSIEKNIDIIQHCNFVQIPFQGTKTARYDLWKVDTYQNEVLDILYDFLHAYPEETRNFKVLTPTMVIRAKSMNTYLPEEALIDIVEHCWQKWLTYFSGRLADVYRKQYEKLRKINNRIRRCSGGPFPMYICHNKTAYFTNYFGHHLNSGTENYLDGFWQFEDYPYSCGYPNTRAIFPMLTLKLHYSRWRIFPEIYSGLWDGCNDGAVSQAHPPYGTYDLPGETIKLRIYEYAFAVVWFKEGKFHYWKDYGFQFRNPKREHFTMLLSAWKKVRTHIPVRPVKTICFLHDMDLIGNHPDYYEKNCNIYAPWKDIFNTAEESLAYSYQVARNAGLPAGFAVSLKDLPSLSREDVDLLVLPPLPEGLDQKYLQAIRSLHQQGINLLGFESVAGLEDLFGVKSGKTTVPIVKIGISPEYTHSIASPFVEEYVNHPLARALYENNGATNILLGTSSLSSKLEIPVLGMKETLWGKTALFNLPPTVIDREKFMEPGRVGYGQECLSVIIRESLTYILRNLSHPAVIADQAKVIAFYDVTGNLVVVVEDDTPISYPERENPRLVLLRVEIPGIEKCSVESDHDYSLVYRKKGSLLLRIFLKKYQAVLLIFKGVSYEEE